MEKPIIIWIYREETDNPKKITCIDISITYEVEDEVRDLVRLYPRHIKELKELLNELDTSPV